MTILRTWKHMTNWKTMTKLEKNVKSGKFDRLDKYSKP